MSPVLAMNNKTDHRRSDVVLLGKPSLLAANPSVGSANSHDILGGEFASAIRSTSVVSTPPTTLPVDGVVQSCSRPKMCRVATRRIVATVKHKRLVISQFAATEQEGDAMGKLRFVALAPPARVLDAIARVVAVACPFPAVIRSRLTDLLPKQFDLSWGNINTHRVLLTLGATPGVVTATPRLSVLSEQLYQIGRTI